MGFIGPGKYDDVATMVRESTQAEAVIIMVVGGNKGSGFSVQAPLEFTLKLPNILRNIAADIEAMI